MKKLIYSFALMMLAVMPASAQDDSLHTKKAPIEAVSNGEAASSSIPKTATAPSIFDEHYNLDIQYASKNVRGENVTLSAKVYYPEPWDEIDSRVVISHVVLNCHPTVTSNFEAPTGIGAIDKDIYRMCGVKDVNIYTSGYYMVVCPDYCGYGISSYEQHPYLIHDITAANCIDAILPAIEKVKEKCHVSPNWDLDIVGYSQGGATALACTKYIQERKDCSNLLNRLRQTTCGDGPYSTLATVNQYIEWGIPAEFGGPDKDLEYPCVLPLIVEAAKQAYGDGCMKTVNTEVYFTDEFLETGIMDMLKTKVTNTNDLNNEIRKKMPRQRPVDLFSDKIINKDGTFKTTTNEYKCLMRALEKGDLTKGWTPQKPLTFYHLPNDGVVPYANFVAAKEGFGNNNSNIRYFEAEDAHKGYEFFDIACTFNNVNPIFELTSHAEGGTVFYVDYMFGTVLRLENGSRVE